MQGVGRRFVYVLRSEIDPARHYVGVASESTSGSPGTTAVPSGYTANHRPWRVLVVESSSPDERAAAVRFEKYLKSGSGRAFTKRHFGPG